jgi:23S rRNA pseudouridine955/2504/2580 synthase
MNDVQYREVNSEEEGQRLDNYLLRILKGVPKSHVYRIIRAGEVRINKKRAKPCSRLCIGDLVRVPPVRTAQEKSVHVGEQLTQRLQACVIFEDDHLLVVNKPAGIAVHGGSGLSLGMIEALRKTRADLPYLELVHRLDKDTSGCLLFAKKRSMLRAIQALLEARAVNKTYWALLAHPWSGKKSLTVDAPLQKNTLKSGERMVVVHAEGKASQTDFKLLENYQHACWVEAKPKTGRTHQIRVHSVCLNHPIVGDPKYGQGIVIDAIQPIQRLYLHARAIQFNLNGQDFVFQADLDDVFSNTLKTLRSKVHHEKALPFGGV